MSGGGGLWGGQEVSGLCSGLLGADGVLGGFRGSLGGGILGVWEGLRVVLEGFRGHGGS